ncbi:AlkZ family DNA glycosylase [Streptomyces durbertensis]|uniref:AlkZ family DNA glycosylase n=1 Tax=Streptomyces durbertensis TaxID=2448886 RepID=A0ABR6EFK2_9ACTN|nr:winged helix DNA-binding domain-containing protein [Streptomyces durbertensis]MBB1244128.1 AlkZ family DNA glycosylase [Streptomyces durbertensis]
MSTPLITDRALNRALLARQLLLERSELTVPEAVEQLVGLQAQTPHTWYLGLWSRLADYDPHATAGLLRDRALVRISLMRSTIHLVTVADALWLRPLHEPVMERGVKGSFGRKLVDVDREELAALGRKLLEEEPASFAALGRKLAERWPGRDGNALAQAVRSSVPLVQLPPRGMWGKSGQVVHTSLESWTGRQVDQAASRERLVLRYLAAFGPATVKDAQTWSGLTRLAEVFDGLRSRLTVFRGEAGQELFDLPDAPRPAADTPAPVRFLYDYDNLLLSHADRSRVLTVDFADQGFGRTMEHPCAVLVDGTVAATWRLTAKSGRATMTVRPFRRLSPAEEEEVRAEAGEALGFLAAPARDREVVFSSD